MSLNIKILIFCLFCGLNLARAQEDAESTEAVFNDDPETVFFNFELLSSLGVGNHSFARDYHPGIGYGIDFNWFVLPKITIGAHYSAFESKVKNPENTGNIQNTSVYLFGVNAGYYYELDQHWNIHATAGIGTIHYWHQTPEDNFTEVGNSYWLQFQVAYRFNKTLAVYFKIQPRWDNLNIQAPEHLNNYFNNLIFLNPGVGFRINFHNPGG